MQLHKARNSRYIQSSRIKNLNRTWEQILENVRIKNHFYHFLFGKTLPLWNEFCIRMKNSFLLGPFILLKSFNSKERNWKLHFYILLHNHANIRSYFVSELNTKVCENAGNACDCVKICYVKNGWMSFIMRWTNEKCSLKELIKNESVQVACWIVLWMTWMCNNA